MFSQTPNKKPTPYSKGTQQNSQKPRKLSSNNIEEGWFELEYLKNEPVEKDTYRSKEESKER